jgi:hypothetical protein
MAVPIRQMRRERGDSRCRADREFGDFSAVVPAQKHPAATRIHVCLARLSKQDVDSRDHFPIKSGYGHHCGDMVQHDRHQR